MKEQIASIASKDEEHLSLTNSMSNLLLGGTNRLSDLIVLLDGEHTNSNLEWLISSVHQSSLVSF